MNLLDHHKDSAIMRCRFLKIGPDAVTKPFCLAYIEQAPRFIPELINPRGRSEEHTSELQSRGHLVCRLLLEKKNKCHLNVASCIYNEINALCSFFLSRN